MTSKMKKLLIVTATSALIALSAAAFVACGETDENTFVGVAKNQEVERLTYDSISYREKLVTDKYTTMGEGVKVDGVIDDEAWTNSYPLSYTYGGVESKLFTAFGEDGLYLAARIDMKAYYRAPRAADNNCGGNFYIAPTTATSLNRNCIQIVYTARGDIRTSRGRNGSFETWYVNTFVKTYVDGGWIEEGDGSLRENGGLVAAGDYVTAEAFVPWAELGLNEKPEAVKVMPQFNYNVSSASNQYRLFAGRPAGAYNNPRDWFLFDEQGYAHNDERLASENSEAVAVGNGYGNMSKTAAWDFSEIAEGKLTSGSMAQTQFIYFKDVYAENWMTKVSVKFDSNTGGAQNAVGLCAEPVVTGATRTPITFNLPTATNLAGIARWTAYTNTDQAHYSPTNVQADVLKETVDLTLIKMGSALFAFIGDTYFGSHQFDAIAGKAVPGIIVRGAVAEFSNMQATTDTDEIFEYIASKNLQTISLNSNNGGAVTLTAEDMTYGGNIVLVERNSEVTLRVSPTISQYSAYVVKSVKIGDDERVNNLSNGELTFAVTGDTNVEVEFEFAASYAVLYGTVSGIDKNNMANASVKFVDMDGRILYAYSGIRQEGNDSVYVFRIPDGTYRLWLEYKGGNYGEYKIRVLSGTISLINDSGDVIETVETIDFDTTARPDSLTRNVTAWVGYPAISLPVSYFKQGEAVTWSGGDSAIATFDEANRTLTAVAAGSFTLTAETDDGYTEIYHITVKTVEKSGNQWDLDTARTNYAKELKTKWEQEGNDNKTTLFIGDSFFDVRNFWTNFYTTYKTKDAICAGIGSTTTYDWEQYAEMFLKYTKPKNIVIHLGTNNLYTDGDSSETLTENLQRLFTLIHDILPNTNIYYFAITQRTSTAHKEEVSKTNADMKEWCEGYSWITFLDTEALITTDMLKDGIHPYLEHYSVFTSALQNSDIVMEKKSN